MKYWVLAIILAFFVETAMYVSGSLDTTHFLSSFAAMLTAIWIYTLHQKELRNKSDLLLDK